MNRALAPEFRNRKRTRIPGFDYSTPGMYFITVCTDGRRLLFGDVVKDQMLVNELGRWVEEAWHGLPERNPGVGTDAFCLMPNHVHGILQLDESNLRPLGQLVSAFKSSSSRMINTTRGTPGALVWQDGFHEHVIRGDDDLFRIRRYIAENPVRWALDPENPSLRRK